MKVVHICLCGPVSDNWNYQENMLTKYQVKLGHQVTLIAPQWAWGNDGKLVKVLKTNYFDNDGVKIIRLPIYGGKDVMYKFKRYKELIQSIDSEMPDILFIHNVQFLDIRLIAQYVSVNPSIKVFVDNHADFSNSARNWLAKHILYGMLWRSCAHIIMPYVTKFYGVLPSRVDFIKNVYKVPSDKVDLLVMGADDELVELYNSKMVISKIRSTYGVEKDDFLIVTGGKIDAFKTQTLLLMEAITKIKNKRIKLIVFGSVSPELMEQVSNFCKNDSIQYIGWISSDESYKYFAAADLVVFPGRHSVFWEQVVGLGIPMICKYWEGTTHVDLGGNVKFLYRDSVEEIQGELEKIIYSLDQYEKMRIVAKEKGMKVFSYKEIAMKSIGE